MKKVSKTVDAATDVAIHTTAVGAGAATGVYCVKRDICNDPETSTVTGIVGGFLVGLGVDAALMKMKRGFITVGKKVNSVVNRKNLNAAIGGDD